MAEIKKMPCKNKDKTVIVDQFQSVQKHIENKIIPSIKINKVSHL